jgi:pyrroloquinoline quinone biosynthesis protein D
VSENAIGVETVPRLAPGVKFRFDRARDAWVLLAPERLFMPDEVAVEVLRRIDGARSVGLIVDDLAAAFKAPRAVIETDVLAMLGDLRNKGALVW